METQARLDPVRMMQYADQWHRQLDSVATVFNQLNHALAAELDEGWRDGGADAAAGAVHACVASSLDGLDHCRSVPERLAGCDTVGYTVEGRDADHAVPRRAYPGRGGRDDGGEHRRPSYLITLDHATDLIGPLPKVAPPVTGE